MSIPTFTLTGELSTLTGNTETPLTGVVLTFTSNVLRGDMLSIDNASQLVAPKSVTLDANGKINGTSGIALLANDASLNLLTPLEWTISASNLPPGQKITKWVFEAPAAGQTVDLKSLLHVAGTLAQGATVGPQGAIGPPGATGATGPSASVTDNADGTVTVSGSKLLQPLATITKRATSVAPVIGQITYYDATSGNLTPPLPALSGLAAGARLWVRRDPVDVSANTVTLSCSGSDAFYSSGTTSTTFPISGEQREYQVVSVAGVKYWAPSGSLNPVSKIVPWSGGTAGILPATSGQKLTTQGGNTLDNGAGGVVIKGGSLDGVTIGATARSTSIRTATLIGDNTLTSSGSTTSKWLNFQGAFAGSNTGGGNLNQIIFNDQIVGDTTYIWGLNVTHNVFSPAVGLRTALRGLMVISSAGVNTRAQCNYNGIYGAVNCGVNLGGTGGAANARGAFFGAWIQAVTTGGTWHDAVIGAEIDVNVQSNYVVAKVGLGVTLLPTDAIRGSIVDAGFQFAREAGCTTSWLTGIMFGSTLGDELGAGQPSAGAWPFASDSTLIGTSAANGIALPANIGVDFSQLSFTDAAIKVGAAAIGFAPMASAPSVGANAGRIYVASDKTLHYKTSSADIQLQSTVGNAPTATKLAAPVNINGVAFDGTAPITVTDATAEKTANKNTANGYAGLDGGGKVAAAQLPAYVDDVLEFANLAAFPGTGTAGIIYVADDATDKTYRWSGSAYIEISPSPGSTDSVTEGSVNKYYTDARADARVAAAVGVSVQAYDSDLTAFAAKTAPAGAVVGTTDAVALTHKDLTDATNTFPTLNQNTTGNAATATKLATARNINGVAFDGTAPITVTDATAEKTANKNTASGYAGLDGGGKVAAAQLPASTVAEYTSTTTGITVPAGVIGVWIESLIGPGGGGGSGKRGAAGTVRNGGGAGASAAVIQNYWVPAARLGATVDLTLPAGGVGGASVTTNDTNGSPGGVPAAASFVSGSFTLSTFAGTAAGGGTSTTGTAGGQSSGLLSGVPGGAANASGGVGAQGGNSLNGVPSGGGPGGGITALDVASNGAAGGFQTLNYPSLVLGTAGVVGGASPGTGSAAVAGVGGLGAGGGAASITGPAQAGATPTGYGAGGSGGGASLNGFASGAGSPGGGPYCRLRWIYV